MQKALVATLVVMLTAIAAVLGVAGDDGSATAAHPEAPSLADRDDTDGPLLVFLAGTGNAPDRYQAFLETAVESGFHVIGLDYANRGRSVSETCAGDAGCYGLLQGNRFDGRTPSRFSAVTEGEGVRARLVAALEMLETQDPGGHWGRYLRRGFDGSGSDVGSGSGRCEVDWRHVVLAGHSQGGGVAAFIAHELPVGAVIAFGAPILTDGDHPASWLSEPGATPVDRLFAFVSHTDKYVDRVLDSWRRLGLPGPWFDADVPVPRSDSPSHGLISTRRLGGPGPSHGRVVNALTPRADDGSPVFAPTWRWLLARARAAALAP